MKNLTIKNIIKRLIDLTAIIFKLFTLVISSPTKPLKISLKHKIREEAIIIGNGPSLNNDKKNINGLINKNRDIYVVNYFAKSSFFKSLKPNYYFFADKMFWLDNILPNVKNENNKIFDILKNIEWPLTIICPDEGFNFIKKKLSSNKKLNFISIQNRPINLLTEKMRLFVLKNRFFTIPNVNSVITLIWCSIVLGYKKIHLFGIDFSGFKSISINQETNELLISPEHFYRNSKSEKNASKKYINVEAKKISHRIFQTYRAFYYLEILSKLAEIKGVDIYNRSSFSYVDSFKRK